MFSSATAKDEKDEIKKIQTNNNKIKNTIQSSTTQVGGTKNLLHQMRNGFRNYLN
jgi:hypothetical protein